jgi:hypothetical protein
MNNIRVSIGNDHFAAQFQDQLAPQTCARFRSLLPWRQQIIHVRWSGEGCWVPLGDLDLELGYENATSHPRPGEMIFYPGGVSETELLLAYGPVSFASKAGQLAGNPFLLITENLERLAEVGREILWQGSREITFHVE